MSESDSATEVASDSADGGRAAQTHATADDAPFSVLTVGRRPGAAVAVAMVALVVSMIVVLGAIVIVMFSGYTAVRGANGASFLEWAPPFTVWQLAVAGVIEFSLIGAAAAAWWGAWSLWSGRKSLGFTLPSPRPFAMGAAIAMIAATALALVTHIRNWQDWHTLITQHPEWHEDAEAWQIPVGAAVALLIVAQVVAMYGFLRRRSHRFAASSAQGPGLGQETEGDR